MTRHLVEIVKELDKTRPVTNGYNDPNGGRASGASMALDVMGVNYFFYEQAKWDQDERYKNMPTIGTETSSCLSTRGVYFQGDTIRKDFQITSYDVRVGVVIRIPSLPPITVIRIYWANTFGQVLIIWASRLRLIQTIPTC